MKGIPGRENGLESRTLQAGPARAWTAEWPKGRLHLGKGHRDQPPREAARYSSDGSGDYFPPDPTVNIKQVLGELGAPSPWRSAPCAKLLCTKLLRTPAGKAVWTSQEEHLLTPQASRFHPMVFGCISTVSRGAGDKVVLWLLGVGGEKDGSVSFPLRQISGLCAGISAFRKFQSCHFAFMEDLH